MDLNLREEYLSQICQDPLFDSVKCLNDSSKQLKSYVLYQGRPSIVVSTECPPEGGWAPNWQPASFGSAGDKDNVCMTSLSKSATLQEKV